MGDKLPVKILSTEARGDYPIVFQYDDSYFVGFAKFNGDIDCTIESLENVPEKHVGWISIYPSFKYGKVYFDETKEASDIRADDKRIACIKIEFEEGEGLND